VLAGRVLGTLVFGMALMGKLRHVDEFIGVVAHYRLVPEVLARPMAWLIVALEGIVTLLLVTGLVPIAAAALAIVLLAAFAVAMTINLARGRTVIDCGCFQSALRQKVSVALIVRNLLLIGALLPLLEATRQKLSLLQAIDGIAAGIVIFVLYQASGQLFALRDAAEGLRKRFA
jgi:uncharacterized membrane protein YphA (DoxX/SURF4 family)